AAARQQQGHAVYYRVRKGDNLGRIAQKYHTTVSKIKKLNRLRSDFIREGQRLRVR
ncbi:MAG: LysM peptidoglycan-binding domain-containing protein, partial [Bacteroidales bacterium]|nr:LysM peptidoglycan-binding domain-containing protein [Bacteroidales bacterium]